MNIVVELTDAEVFELDLVMIDRQAWADNFLRERAHIAKDELKFTTEWAQAALALGDASDDWAVLMNGRELGLFKDAATRQAEIETQPAICSSSSRYQARE
ncbi:MAG TPA: hypothetical protein VL147_05035 [Devosia sp.]|nr:hypothetical protein [Devosia sp.]